MIIIIIQNVNVIYKDNTISEINLVYERQRYDGWYNNMANPDWGSVDSRLARKTPATYEDGVYLMAETNRSSFGSY